ncbi:MAG: hypothetical protein ACUZ8E_08675 [Candidatus Anammoxibacter sp.]
MTTTSIETVVKMMEYLPEDTQNQVVEQVRRYVEEIQDELEWDSLFKKNQDKLTEAAKLAKCEIAEGKATPMDYNQL